jgi:hypothetical protein
MSINENQWLRPFHAISIPLPRDGTTKPIVFVQLLPLLEFGINTEQLLKYIILLQFLYKLL